MYQTSFWLVLFIVAFASLPWLLKWVQRRTGLGKMPQEGGTRLISSLALSPSQRVVTVEVMQGQARTRLVLGVTPQAINCLHVMPGADDVISAPGVPAVEANFQSRLDAQKDVA